MIYASHIYRRIHEIYILFIQLVAQQLNCFAKTLEMNNFALSQELDDIIHIRVIGQTQNVIVSGSRFLLCCDLICTTQLTYYGTSHSQIIVDNTQIFLIQRFSKPHVNRKIQVAYCSTYFKSTFDFVGFLQISCRVAGRICKGCRQTHSP